MKQEIEALLERPIETLDEQVLRVAQNAVTSRHPKAAQLMARVLDAPNGEPYLRAGAVRLLAASPTQDAERRVIRLLDKDVPPVVRESAAAALALIGDETALLSLEHLAELDQSDNGRMLRFAHVLISHRRHIASKFLALPLAEERLRFEDRAQSFQGRAVGLEVMTQIRDDLRGSSERLMTPAREGLEFVCGKARSVLVLNLDVIANGPAAELQRPSILGIVARYSPDHERWYIARTLLTGPVEGNTFYVAVYRRDGVLDLYGTGSLDRREFEVVSAPRLGGTAIRAQGYWHGTSVVMSGVSGTRKLPRRKAEPVDRPVEPAAAKE